MAQHKYLRSERRWRNTSIFVHSADGARYNSQGQARSASPLEKSTAKKDRGLKGRNRRRRITPIQGWSYILDLVTRGDALASLALAPWLLYCAPLALSSDFLCKPCCARKSTAADNGGCFAKD
jgi:hypothetical protein